jgi:hypothetical protein
MFGKLLHSLLYLAPTGGVMYAYVRLRAAAAERRVADAQAAVYGDPLR